MAVWRTVFHKHESTRIHGHTLTMDQRAKLSGNFGCVQRRLVITDFLTKVSKTLEFWKILVNHPPCLATGLSTMKTDLSDPHAPSEICYCSPTENRLDWIILGSPGEIPAIKAEGRSWEVGRHHIPGLFNLAR